MQIYKKIKNLERMKGEITMTTETMKQNLINSIIDEDADNPYKKQLLEIMKNHDEGKLTDIESYLLINDILTRYDFDVIMPKENEAIKETRKSYELSDFICNPDDATEVAIKTKTEIGQIFQKGRKEFIRTIGVENLNMKDREGNLITDINKVSKGKRKSEADNIINQYCKIQNRPDIKQYAIQITDIFDIPILEEILDTRGKSGFYKDKIIPLMVKYLLFHGNIITTIDKLSKGVGLVGTEFKNSEFEYKIMESNRQITTFRIDKFYSYCKPEQQRIIFGVLNALQNDYSVISYYTNFWLINKDGSQRTSTKKETDDIRDAQGIVLKEFGVSRIFSIYKRGRKIIEKFYNRVYKVLNTEYGFNCEKYYNQIEIHSNVKLLENLDSKLNLDNEECKMLKNEIQEHFIEKIKDRIKADYERNTRLADKKDAENMKEWEENTEYKNNIPHDIQELLDIGVYSESDVKSKLLPKPKPAYRYPENHVEVLYYLCDCLLPNI